MKKSSLVQRIKCFFDQHEEEAIFVYHYIRYRDPHPYYVADKTNKSEKNCTVVTYRCKNCGKLRTQDLINAGFLELSDINQQPKQEKRHD